MTTAVREERKVVTALFADIVGSTALAEHLEPEDVKLVIGDAVARIVGEIEALGGHVKDLAGDGVLAFFGAPTTREDDAERALRAALRIAAEIDDYAREVHRGWGIEGFGVRIGAATGQVVLGEIGAGSRVEYAAFGDTVNTAARLQGAAERGSTIVDDATKRAVDVLFEWSDAVELELKGKSEPVRAWPLLAARSGVRTQRGLPGVETRLVGRSRELARGREALEALAAGRGGVLVVAGDPGIGKSRLLGELRLDAERRGIRWLEGRCVSYGESLPYWPFRDLVRGEWIGAGADEAELRVRIGLRRRLDQLLGDEAQEVYPYLGALLDLALEPEAAARIAELSPEALQWRTFEVVATLFARLADDAPLVLAIEDVHWADPTSVQLLELMLGLAEDAAVLLVLSMRPERDHAAWRLRETAAREFPHLLEELDLEPLGDADGELLTALVGQGTLPAAVERRVLEAAEGNPFFLEEVVRSLVDAGALVQSETGWRYDHEVEIEVPQTVEKVILARIDRLSAQSHDVLTAASALGRRFALPLLDGVLGDDSAGDALHELQRLGLVQQSRRWPHPEFRFRHALIQETAYRTLLGVNRARLHRRAAEWLEERYGTRNDEVLGLLAHHWLQAENEDKAVDYLLRAGDKARQEYALDEAVEHYRALLRLLDERGENQASALVRLKLALAFHTSLRFADANATYARAFELWSEPTAVESPSATLRMTSSFLPTDVDPRSAIAWPNIQLCMQLFDRLVVAWPERTIVPSLAERWEIADDGLRYVFYLREKLAWSDGTPLTAHDVEYGIKRVLDPRAPGSSVAIYFVLEQGEATYLGTNTDWDAVGVRALDDRTVEFRLSAPAPYFMSVMNRPDAGPLPHHAIEQHGADWTQPELQVVSGAFRRTEAAPDRVVLERRDNDTRPRSGNVRRVEIEHVDVAQATERFRLREADLVPIRYTPRKADLADVADGAVFGPAGWSGYLAFDHARMPSSSLAFRRALAHAIDREALARLLPSNLVVATGGVVPPALQGHTPDIAPRFDPDLARSLYETCALGRPLRISATADWSELLHPVVASWRDVLDLDVEAADADADLTVKGWLPGYADPEYYLRLLFQSTSRTNEGGFADPDFDALIERARQERSDRGRLERFHEADRYVVADRVAVIPLVYGRSMALVRPGVDGWWEFGKTSVGFADLHVR